MVILSAKQIKLCKEVLDKLIEASGKLKKSQHCKPSVKSVELAIFFTKNSNIIDNNRQIMTTPDSNFAAINTASQFLTGNAIKNKPIEIASQTLNDLGKLDDNFSTIFSGAQQFNEATNQPTSSHGNTKNNAVNNIQQSLFSSLGLVNLSSQSNQNALEALTSQSSIEVMQASLLSALQTSIFSTQPKENNAAIASKGNTEVSSATQNDNKTAIINTTERTSSTKTASNKLNDESTKVTGNQLIDSLSKFSFGEDGFDVKDGFDMFNVLQHIPVVSAVYQDVTEQDISAISKLSGGYLYGGILGLAVSALDVAIESFSGSSMNETFMNFDYASLFNNQEVEVKPQITSEVGSRTLR